MRGILAHMRIDSIRVRERLRPLDPAKVAGLAESIRQRGLLQPIGVRKDGTLVYGYHRLEACKQLGWTEIPALVLEQDSELETELAEIEENLIRNELTLLERAEHLARLKELYHLLHPNARRVGRPAENCETVSSFSEHAARLIGATIRTVQQNLQIVEQIDRKVRDAIRNTPLANAKRELLELARLPAEQQAPVAEILLRGRAESVSDALRILERSARESAKPHLRGQYAGLEIRRGDFRIVLSDIPDRSVDIILTDPPYTKEYLPLWDDLGAFAARVLKPTGILLAYSGQMYLLEAAKALEKHLRWWWQLAVTHRGGRSLIVLGGRRFRNGYKPILMFVPKDSPGVPVVADDLLEGAGREKRLHNWQQPSAEARRLLETFGKAGDLVIDPFAGSGSFGKAAVELGMRFIGAEVLGVEEPVEREHPHPRESAQLKLEV